MDDARIRLSAAALPPDREAPAAAIGLGAKGLGRRTLLGGLLAVPPLFHGGTGQAQTAGARFPTRPVRLVVPFPPGGSVDPVARLITQKLGEIWNQRLVIENRAGGATIIGTEIVANAPNDGYTLLFTASTHVTNSILFSDLPYDPWRHFRPVTTVYRAEFALVMHPSVPANNLQELIAYARQRPNVLNYGSAGPGNASHIAGERFSSMTGVQMVHVAYRGGGPLITDLLRGDVQLYFAVPTSILGPIREGRLKAIAVSGDVRLGILPDVPTFAEAGLPGFGIRSWIGIWAPAGTPDAAVNRIAADMATVLRMPDVRERLLAQGQEPFITTPEEMLQAMREERDVFERVVRDANIRVER